MRPIPPRPPRRGMTIIMIVMMLVGLGTLSAFGAFRGGGRTTPAPTPSSTATPTPTPAIQNVVLDGQQADADPTSRPVRSAGPTSGGWADLALLFGADTSYTECVREVTGVDRKSWSTYEKHAGSELVIFASNVGKMTDAEIRRVAASDPQNAGVENLPDLPIRRVNGGFVNTKWSPDGGCEEFTDKRRLVRVSMVPVTDDGELDMSRGVFIGCHNPWRLMKSEAKASPRKTDTSSTPRGPATPRPPHVVVTKKSCPPSAPHGRWPACKDGPDKGVSDKLPREQQPDRQTARPDHKQPDKPADPPKERQHTPPPPKATTTPRATPPPPRATGAPPPENPGTSAPLHPGG